MEYTALKDILIILASSVFIVLLSQKLKLPAIIGFLLTGILIGPGGLGWVHDSELVELMAEIGVIMLLFVVGLEFSVDRLKSIRRSFWYGGSLQVILTTVIVSGIFYILNFPLTMGILSGFIIALSSTAVVIRELNDRREFDSLTGRTSIGILLFQDFAIVPMAAIIPFLAGTVKTSWAQLGIRVSILILAVPVGLILARKLFPLIFKSVAQTRSREIFVLTTLMICLGMAFLTSLMGLSPALGAFIAGIIISESRYNHQVVADILPFRDLFNSIFFISIGMSLNIPLVWGMKSKIILLSSGIIMIKVIILFLILRLIRYTKNTAVKVAFGLAQVGEFSFVLANLGSNFGLLTSDGFQMFIGASIITIFITPFLFKLTRKDWKDNRVEKKLIEENSKEDRKGDSSDGDVHNVKNHVVIAGYGLNGSNLARVLRGSSIPYVILELNPDNMDKAEKENKHVIFGDVSNFSVLITAGVPNAKIIVFTISDSNAARRGIRLARQMNPDIFIIVRTRFVSEIDELYKLGANHVVPEEFETAIELFTKTLEEYHLPANVIQVQRELIRSEGYSILRGKPQDANWSDKIMNILAAGTVQAFLLEDGSAVINKSLWEINLRKLTGATVISVVRSGKAAVSPGPDFILNSGDILVLVASHRDMDRAFNFLRSQYVKNQSE